MVESTEVDFYLFSNRESEREEKNRSRIDSRADAAGWVFGEMLMMEFKEKGGMDGLSILGLRRGRNESE